ncbi:hypothetical protein KO481_15330 [Nocardia sp. NEAU-G5]|uniref:Uncharacterized protein n=1 Tax=Nocardia albiluteola TaxID=2842303 RepID=A0ABS6B0A0_9NOCA|nr:hypothetical protein [Nocardia albiluteola]MBU3062891.1 hypothetical protein [Nocardia albiluteola]
MRQNWCAEAAATPEAACGAGYYAIDHYDLKIAVGWLMYNGSIDCVVTWKTQQVGTSTPLVASVGAGPVYWNAPHSCIEWYVSDPSTFPGGATGRCAAADSFWRMGW